jgi:hypothetical protein
VQPTPSSRTRQYTHIFPRSRRFIAHVRRRHHHSRPSVAHANGFHSQLRLVATSIFSRRIIPTRTFASVFTAPLPFPTIINVNPRAHTRQSPPHRARYHPRLRRPRMHVGDLFKIPPTEFERHRVRVDATNRARLSRVSPCVSSRSIASYRSSSSSSPLVSSSSSSSSRASSRASPSVVDV